jgi:hypothetical protein
MRSTWKRGEVNLVSIVSLWVGVRTAQACSLHDKFPDLISHHTDINFSFRQGKTIEIFSKYFNVLISISTSPG